MAELIYSTTLTGFALQADSTTVYEVAISTGAPSIAKGTVYTILWDGKRYVCAAKDGKLGNEILSGSGVHSGEPFLYMDNGDGTGKVLTSDTETSHDIAIYEGQDNPDGYLMYERTIPCTQGGDGTVYGGTLYAGAPVLTVGNTYTVIWDGVKYVCTAEETTIYDMTAVGVGNLSIAGAGATTEEPFAYLYAPDMGMGLLNTLSTETEHVVSIYDGVLEEDSGEEVGKVIFAEQVLPFSKNPDRENFIANTLVIGISPAVLEVGKTYTVSWDGDKYVCVAENMTMSGVDGIGIGNKSVENIGEDTKEPFLIGYMAVASVTAFSTLDTSESHTVAIYEGDITSGGTEDGYLLKDAELAFELETNSETVYYNNEVAVAISVGKTYTVIWDGSYYDCTAKEYTKDSLTAVVLGNLNIQDNTAENTGEPFLYLYVNVEGNAAANFNTLEKDASHVISIYDGVLEHPAVTYADIYTYDKDGKAVLHEKRSTVTFDTPDGRYAVFKLSHIADSRS